MLHPGHVHSDDVLREASIGASIAHPNVVTVYGVTVLVGQLGIMGRGSLKSLLDEEAHRDMEGLPPLIGHTDRVDFAVQAARGLRELMQHKCIHSDVRAANVLLGEKVLRGRVVWEVKLADFGLVRHVTVGVGEELYYRDVSHGVGASRSAPFQEVLSR